MKYACPTPPWKYMILGAAPTYVCVADGMASGWMWCSCCMAGTAGDKLLAAKFRSAPTVSSWSKTGRLYRFDIVGRIFHLSRQLEFMYSTYKRRVSTPSFLLSPQIWLRGTCYPQFVKAQCRFWHFWRVFVVLGLFNAVTIEAPIIYSINSMFCICVPNAEIIWQGLGRYLVLNPRKSHLTSVFPPQSHRYTFKSPSALRDVYVCIGFTL
jgi:hypothetical protein